MPRAVPPATPAAALAARASDPTPLVTYYDDATGERVELSGVTTANWVAKTANLLRDGYGLDGSARVGLLLPAHWQTVVWLLATWTLGACATDDPDVDVAVCAVDRLDEAAAADERLALSLAPLGRPIGGPLPSGVLDYALEVPGQGDHFAAVAVPPGAPAWAGGPELVTHGGLMLAGLERTTGNVAGGADTTARRLVAHDDLDLAWALDAAVVPLLGRSSVVLVRHADRARADARRAAEKIT